MQDNTQDYIEVGSNSDMKIDWFLVTDCQYKCTYCNYPTADQPKKNIYSSYKKIILKKILTAKNITINLLGGEPSLHPDFFEIIDELYNSNSIKEIQITTNLHMPLEFWLKLKQYKDKLLIIVSYHIEYSNDKKIEKVFELDKIFDVELNFMVHRRKEHLQEMKRASELFKEIKYINYTPVDEYYPFDTEVLHFIKEIMKPADNYKRKKIPFISKENKEMKTIEDIKSNNLTSFTGWKCSPNFISISPYGIVSSPCKTINKLINIFEFEELNSITCTNKNCPWDDFVDYIKTKQ